MNYTYAVDALVTDTRRQYQTPNSLLHVEGHGGRTIVGDISQPFRIHSITKLFVSAAIVRAGRKNSLDINEPICTHLPHDIIAGLHVWNGHDITGEITIRQLATHTSGLRDYFEDDSSFLGWYPKFYGRVLAEPRRIWQGEEMLNYYRQNFLAMARPGEKFHYSDTNYVLLGLILERLFSKPLHEILREEFLAPLNLAATWMEFREPAPAAQKIMRVKHGFFDYTDMPSVTSDWAGGGLASTTADLIKWLRHIRSEYPEMFLFEEGRNYGFGVERRRIATDHTFIGHSGFNNSFVYHYENADVYLAGTFNQSTFNLDGFLEKFVALQREQRIIS